MNKKKSAGLHLVEGLKNTAAIIVALGVVAAFGKEAVSFVVKEEVKKEIKVIKKCYKDDQKKLLDEIGLLKFYIREGMPEHKRRSAEKNYREFKGKN